LIQNGLRFYRFGMVLATLPLEPLPVKAISSWKSLLEDESGNVLVIAALSMTLLLGFGALATDVGVMLHVRRGAQTAADSAAITGAYELYYSDLVSAAKADAARNGFTDGSSGVSVAVNNPPLHGPSAGNAGYVEVIVTKTQSTFLMRLFNRNSLNVSARAVATRGINQNCLYALGTTGTDITVTNGVQIDFTGCNLYGNSTSNSDFSGSGGAHLTANNINLVGNQNVSNGAHINATVNTGTVPLSDPLGYLSPPSYSPSSCLADPINNQWFGGTKTIGPSGGGTVCYNGLQISQGDTVSLNPGTYIINGQLSFQGGATISGTGVTFYLPPGASLNIANGIAQTLTAPTSGTYNGVLFYQDRQNSTAESLQGGASSSFEGIMYFPAANFTFTNGTNTTTYAAIISKTVTFSGGTKVQNYALKNSASPLNTPRLVE
jgi:hypothetical protein